MPRPSIIGHTLSSGVGQSITLNVPTGVVNGDYLLSIIRSNQTGVHNPPSGWTKLQELNIFTHSSGAQGINAGALFYRSASGEPSNYIFDIESGKYTAVSIGIRDTNGIDTYSVYNSGLTCLNPANFGTKVNYTGGLSLDIFGAMSPLVGGSFINIYEAPFNGTYHSGVSLSISSGYLQYSSTGNYSPPKSVSRASGSQFLNSGDLYYQPPSIYYFGVSLEFKPTGI